MNKSIKDVTRVLAAVVALSYGHTAFGQTTQTFTVEVASALTLIAPADATISHDETDSSQSFGVSGWGVTCNNAAGATVDFTTSAVFANGATNRDLTMSASVVSSDIVGGNPVWTVTPSLATYSSDYANGNVTGQVQAVSSGAGNATLGLAMVFVDNDFSVLPSGNYSVTVTGTITAN